MIDKKDVIKIIEEKEIKYKGQMGFCIGAVGVRDIINEIKQDVENLTKHNSQPIQSAISSKELIRRHNELRKHPERGIKLRDL